MLFQRRQPHISQLFERQAEFAVSKLSRVHLNSPDFYAPDYYFWNAMLEE